MLSQDIRNCSIALGTIIHTQDESQAAVLRLVRQQLRELADYAEEVEIYHPLPTKEAQ